MGFLLGIAANCEWDRRGPRLRMKRCPLRPPRRAGALPSPRVRSRCRSPRSWRVCKSEKVDRRVVRGAGENRPADRPKAERGGSPVNDRLARANVSTAGAAPSRRPKVLDRARKAGMPACSSDCTRRNDRRRFRPRTPSARSGTGSAAAENCGSSDSLAGFFTPGKTQFKVAPPRDPGFFCRSTSVP
jgi:hypothetical protein